MARSASPRPRQRRICNRCASADVAWAIARLRPQSRAPNDDVCPLDAWPDVPRTYIYTSDDRIVRPEHAQYIARSRCGVESIEMDGDHSPFLSNVGELATLLLGLG